ncbi:MAG TPA: phage antirepressor N-terminal domain-containing protein [Herpetosiphonaceae bacterium]
MNRSRSDGYSPRFVFYEDDIIALQDLDANEVYVPLNRLCETLGLEPAAQARALEAHSILVNGLRSLGRDGLGLRVDLVPLWLCTIDAMLVGSATRSKLIQYQQECASVLWQAFKPQGFGPEDAILPDRTEMIPAEQAYQGAMAQAALARQQMLIERQLEFDRANGNRSMPGEISERHSPALDLARAVRRVAHSLAARSRRNEYSGVFSGLHRQFGISSYRNLPYGRLREAMDWLERWHGDIQGEPEPPPDI